MPADRVDAGGGGYLRGALREFRNRSALEFKPPSLAELWRRSEDLAERCAKVQSAAPEADVIEQSHAALLKVRAGATSLRTLTVRELRWAPFALFFPANSPERWLASDEGLLTEFLEWIDRGQQKKALVRLLRAFVLHYEPSLRTHETLRSGIQRLLDRFDAPRVVERKAWAEEHHVLEQDGPRIFARDWLTRPMTIQSRLQRFGRDGELSVSRFVRAVETVVCEDVRSVGARLTYEQFSDALGALSIAHGAGLQRFRDPATGTAFANAVLLAFATAGRPPERLRMAIRQALVDRLGDPRLPSHSAAWNGVSPAALQVFRRWLVDDTLRVFFEVISESVQNSPAKKAQWDTRRRFWTAYLDDISDAWVALSPSAVKVTLGNDSFRDMPHARMEGSADNAALIMAIEDLLIVEFATVGGVRFWPASGREDGAETQAPELFKTSYRMADFRVNERLNVPHHDGWDAKVRAVIRNETGVRGNH